MNVSLQHTEKKKKKKFCIQKNTSAVYCCISIHLLRALINVFCVHSTKRELAFTSGAKMSDISRSHCTFKNLQKVPGDMTVSGCGKSADVPLLLTKVVTSAANCRQSNPSNSRYKSTRQHFKQGTLFFSPSFSLSFHSHFNTLHTLPARQSGLQNIHSSQRGQVIICLLSTRKTFA